MISLQNLKHTQLILLFNNADTYTQFLDYLKTIVLNL